MPTIKIDPITLATDAPIFDDVRALEIVKGHLVVGMRDVVEFGMASVQGWTPIGGTGNLQASITTRIEQNGPVNQLISGVVFSTSRYAEYVEFDTIPHWAPIAPLKLWARVKLGDERLAYPVQRAIARRGTRGQHMFERSVVPTHSYAVPRLQAAVDSAARELGGTP